ncbi:protein NDR1-like [Prosopis cineraria]|uniref:protein NDR1-like n=1 Tax=Prosopis cineraria TaxID=364024 RepID=UPI00240F0947|nr:protein NDR1-like [Prosopis cineraria]
MESEGGGSCCKCCFSFLITLGLTSLFLWLSLRTNEPKCYVGFFYVPALNQSLNTPSNSTIVFTVEFDNGNKDKGIRYDDVNVTFGVFLDPNRTRPIANHTIDGFYQGHQKNAKKQGSVEVHGGGLNGTAKVNGQTYFRVNFTTSVKYKILLWYTRRHSLWGGANVPVDNSGKKIGKKGIRLGHTIPVIVSDASRLAGCYCTLLILGLFVNFLFLDLFL